MSIKSKKLYVKENKQLRDDVFLMTLVGSDFSHCEYGQFLNILVSGTTLRRPFSFYNITNDEVSFIYQVVGKVTQYLSELNVDSPVEALVGLGTGYVYPSKSDKVLLISGGIGVGPVYGYYNHLKGLGYDVSLMSGFRDESFLIDPRGESVDYLVYDNVDKNVVEYIADNNVKFDYYYACGPHKMLTSLASLYKSGQLLLEAKMACGFGLCMACPIKTNEGYKRVCVEGPMFYAKELNAES